MNPNRLPCFLSFLVLALWTQHSIPMSQTIRMGITYGLIVYLLFIHIKIFKQSYDEIYPDLGEFKSG